MWKGNQKTKKHECISVSTTTGYNKPYCVVNWDVLKDLEIIVPN